MVIQCETNYVKSIQRYIPETKPFFLSKGNEAKVVPMGTALSAEN